MLTLGELIALLEAVPDKETRILRQGFGKPRSYRGYYEQLAFEPVENVTVASMLEHAKSALGKTFTGYKGGDYTMHEYTDCWIAEYGEASGHPKTAGLSRMLLEYMLKDTVTSRP